MADRSSAVKAMRDMADSSHGCNSWSAIVLRRRKLRASVSSYAAASISIAILVQQVGSDASLNVMLQKFQRECEPVQHRRNKQVGHNDLNTALYPKDNPIPWIGRPQMEAILRQ